jgi:hypothetical protein
MVKIRHYRSANNPALRAGRKMSPFTGSWEYPVEDVEETSGQQQPQQQPQAKEPKKKKQNRYWEDLLKYLQETALFSLNDYTSAHAAGLANRSLKDQFEKSVTADQPVILPFDKANIEIILTPDSATCVSRDDSPVTPEQAYHFLLVLRETHAGMVTDGIEIDIDSASPEELAYTLLAAQEMGFYVANEKDVFNKIGSTFNALKQAWVNFKATQAELITAAEQASPAIKEQTVGKARAGVLNDQNIGQMLTNAGIIDQKTYDDRGNLQAMLLVLRDAYKTGKVTQQQLQDKGVWFTPTVDRVSGKAIMNMDEALKKHAELPQILEDLGITGDIDAARILVNSGKGVNGPNEEYITPYMGVITNRVFPDIAEKEQKLLIVQQAVRALERVNGTLTDEQKARFAAHVERTPNDRDPDLQTVWALHQKAVKTRLGQDEVRQLLEKGTKALDVLSGPDRRPYELLLKNLAAKQGVTPPSPASPAPTPGVA